MQGHDPILAQIYVALFAEALRPLQMAFARKLCAQTRAEKIVFFFLEAPK